MKWMTCLHVILCMGLSLPALAQSDTEETEDIAFGNMDQWMVRVVDESFVIGGNTKYLYEITSGDTLKNNTPYQPTVSPWATSTVMAKVSGIYKGSITVFPEERDNGYCARLETRMEHVKVLGLINISVLATGTIFLGEIMEPVRDTKNPQGKLNNNVPFDKHPKALQFDYKVQPGGEQIKATGFGRIQNIPEQNNAEACLLLQYRWEDEKGNVFARRVGTAYERYDQEVNEQPPHPRPLRRHLRQSIFQTLYGTDDWRRKRSPLPEQQRQNGTDSGGRLGGTGHNSHAHRPALFIRSRRSLHRSPGCQILAR